MKNNGRMFIYGFDEKEIDELKKIVSENKLPGFSKIEENMSEMRIRDIIKGVKMETHNEELPNCKLVLFNKFVDKEIETAIKAIRNITESSPIFATVTPTSMNWTIKHLLDELNKEREWYIKNGYKNV
ncbi:DUF3783 domain-containing protein [Clostridium felsineum]|uniref:Uncharacterized protein n=1 Tax=Clostridium felsineum TaxID=36839 RepID=A0A1S8LWZ2_9CLOT|nr:DUF3783 domain-containing protein [Clostridium felsineum]URZ03315.1 hypothetical protein CLAUR_033610 [Clostridium felsineum]URZ08351.1 hypothetical protein CLROS_037330 [Clostridium felsineum]URZ13382.1 hypothetical protein CROST_041480 [Clostridium felsineum]URZ14641.1 hypothetical protein CLFE_006380 [Clostridium felsineum DSM 794]